MEKGAFKASTGNMLLANKIAKMLNHSHKVLVELEKSLSEEVKADQKPEDGDSDDV